jgi:hypothetical protein
MLRDRGVREESELADDLGLHVVATIDHVPGGASTADAPPARRGTRARTGQSVVRSGSTTT